MEIIMGGRRCMNRERAHRIVQISREMELKIPLPITFDEFLNRQYAARGNVGHLYIDDADMLIRHISRVSVAAITLTDCEE